MIRLTKSGEWTQTPADRMVLGCFLEAGFGRQGAKMWSEMIFNRAFREIPPYKAPTWGWMGIEQEYYNENAPFWHSGYEEHDWAFFGDVAVSRTLGTNTWKGMTSIVINNRSNTPGGARQAGIRLEKGREYIFTMQAGLTGWLGSPGLNGFGDPDYVPRTKPVDIRIGENRRRLPVQTTVQPYEWRFTAEKTECGEIEISLPEAFGLLIPSVSLMPADNMDGWRREVVALLKEAAPSVIRFPGGCYTSFYNWRDTVGPRDARDPKPSFYWGGLEENDVGVDEFMRLSELAGFEAQFCFNMMSSDPFSARQLVEYLNAPADTGMGRLRMLNGRAEPYGVRLFEMDNEPARKWSAEQYAVECVRFAREMRLADPSIEFMMAAYPYPTEHLADMLDICGEDIQYVAYREGKPEFVAGVLETLRAWNRAHGKNIRLVNTEWLAPCDSPEPFEDPEVDTDFEWRGVITNDYRKTICFHERSWNYALNGAHRILDYVSYGGEFALANFNNLCNTWGQNLIEASADRAWLSCMGEIFSFFRRHFRPCLARPVQAEGEGAEKLFALLTRAESGDKLYIINHSAAAFETALPEGTWVHLETLTGKGRMYGVTETETPVYSAVPEEKDGYILLPGLSVSVYKKG